MTFASLCAVYITRLCLCEELLFVYQCVDTMSNIDV